MMEDSTDLKEKISLKTAVLELPPCKICTGKASGIHYGVNTCEACKGFFRRYLSRKEPYKCTKGGNCTITDSPRGNCSGCRMRKCLDLGMSKEAVRQGRYTLTERTQTINEVKRLQEQDCDEKCPDNKPLIPDDTVAELVCDDTETKQIATCNSSPDSGIESQPLSNENSSNSKSSAAPCEGDSVFVNSHVDSPLSSVIKNGVEEMIKATPITPQECQGAPRVLPVEDSLWTTDIVPKLLQAMQDLSPVTSKLTDEEINNLHLDGLNKYDLKEKMFGSMEPISTEEYNKIFTTTGLDVDGRHQRLQKELVFAKYLIKHYVKFSRAIPNFQKLQVSDQSTLLKAARFEFFMLLENRSVNPDINMLITIEGDVLHLNEVSAYVPKNIMKSWFDFSKVIRKLCLSTEERAIVMAMCLTFSDRVKLEEPDKVEDIQLNLISYLRHLFRQRSGDQERRMFTEVMDMFISFRALTEQYMGNYKKLMKETYLPQQFPELLQFLFDDDEDD